jgi:hypothetical protein
MESNMIWLLVFLALMIAGGIAQFVVNLRKRRAKESRIS